MLLLRLRELESAQIGWPATAQTQQMRSGLVRGTLVISAYIVAPGRQVRLLQVLPDEYRRLDRAAEPCEDVQIGRASCREGGWPCVGGGLGEIEVLVDR